MISLHNNTLTLNGGLSYTVDAGVLWFMFFIGGVGKLIAIEVLLREMPR